MSSRIRVAAVLVLSASTLTAGSGAALAQAPQGGDDRRPTKTSIDVKGLDGGRLTVGEKVKVAGKLRPYAAGQRVTVVLYRGKKVVDRETVGVDQKKGAAYGKFSYSKRLIKQGRYSVQAIHKKNADLGGSKDSSRTFKIRYPDLDPGNSGDVVKTFNNLLARQGYVNDEGKKYDSATGRAVQAFHKVNKEGTSENADPSDFETLAAGKGGFKLKSPELGKHVEADLSRQVMVLAKGDKVDEIYTISSGTSATPTVLGKYNFYRKEPGYNNVEMYYSVYFHRGYATHGYKSVPDYPASHGCLRNPIPNSVHIYNWIDIGDPIHVYR